MYKQNVTYHNTPPPPLLPAGELLTAIGSLAPWSAPYDLSLSQMPLFAAPMLDMKYSHVKYLIEN